MNKQTLRGKLHQQRKEGTSMSHASAMNSLLDKSTKPNQKRKASTPVKDKTSNTSSPDISSINITLPQVVSSKENDKIETARSKARNVIKTTVKNEISLQDEMSIEHTRYIQNMFKIEMAKSRFSKIDSELANVQASITTNERKLQLLTERLNDISFNNEVEALHQLHNPVCSKIIESLDETNYEGHLSELNKQMEQAQNQLSTKNIEAPKGGTDQLMRVIGDTLGACEQLNSFHDVNIPSLLKEIKDSNQITVNAIVRCEDNLSTCEKLLIKKTAIEICASHRFPDLDTL